MEVSTKAFVKSALSQVCSSLGVNKLLRNRLHRHLLVLCYHGVVEKPQEDRYGYGNTVSASEFRAHLEFLAKHFRPVSADQLIAHRKQGKELPLNAALVTFDDGYRNNLTLAAPLLRSVGVPCVFFVSTNYVGTREVLWTDDLIGRVLFWNDTSLPMPEGGERALPNETESRRRVAQGLKELCKRLPWDVVKPWLGRIREASNAAPSNAELYDFMDWNEVRELHRQGFEIGSHTMEHPILTRIGPDALQRELVGSKLRIEQELGLEQGAGKVRCRTIAYPNGGASDVSPEVFSAAGAAGYELGFTVGERHSPPGEDQFSISRLCIQGHLPMSEFTYRVDGLQRAVGAG